jgi:hypothetical protein
MDRIRFYENSLVYGIEAEFLDKVVTKVLRVFLPGILSHL